MNAQLQNQQNENSPEVTFIYAFLGGTIHTLKVQCSYEVMPEKSRVYQPNQAIPTDICGVIGLVSNVFRGCVILCFNKKVFLDVMGSMFGEKFSEITDELSDGVGELLNIIFGTAKTAISNAGFSVERAIPIIIKGNNVQINSLTASGISIVIPFVHNEDRFHVIVGLGSAQPELKKK